MIKQKGMLAFCMAGLAVVCVASHSECAVSEARQAVMPIKPAPYYSRPGAGELPAGYLGKNDTCRLDSIGFDTLGTPWFFLKHGKTSICSPASNWRYATESADETSGSLSKDDTDRNRRIQVLQVHRDWPRRIIKAVREGTICLDMTSEQLIASWNEPVQKSRSFIIGVGNCDTWFYKDRNKNLLAVILVNDRVTGWTLGE